MSPDSYQPPPYRPYVPPWYPRDDNPEQIVSTMSGDLVRNYDRWERSLPDGELIRRVREYRRSVDEGLPYDRETGRCVEHD